MERRAACGNASETDGKKDENRKRRALRRFMRRRIRRGENKRMCLFTLGTGVGGGFTDCGKLQSGSAFADASDIFGHVTVEKNGRQCTCGRKGCLEAYASATAVMKENERRGGGKLTAKEIFDLARSGEKTQKEIVEEFTDYLAEGIADVVNVLRPETVAVGGGLSAAADLYLGNLEKK